MELHPGIHIVTHLVLSIKTGCDIFGAVRSLVPLVEKKYQKNKSKQTKF
jgi:hypothetical protein